MSGTVWLVGAGCAEADLITVRGLALLRRCETLVYDDLIDPELPRLAPEGAERVYVGKRGGRPSAAQEDICRLLIDRARRGKRVVRLKGGDPFVFGRGGEELAALRAAGVPCGEVPGVTSAIAVPAAGGIPVTYRALSRAVHIVTAHTAGTDGGLPEDFDRLAGLDGTLVLLMGLGRLPRIVRRLIAAGKAPDTPAAVISGDGPIRGPLERLPELAAGAVPPAVIVVGPAAALDLSPTLPLSGVRIGLTGTDAVTGKLSALLRELGARAFTVQRAAVRPLPADLASIPERGWLAFTSANGVERFFQMLDHRGMDLRRFARCRFAVIGKATGAALRARGLRPDLCPEPFTSAALGEALLRAAGAEEPVTLLRSAQGTAELPGALRRAGRKVRDLPLYDVRPDPEGREARAALAASAGFLVFSSAGGVRSFLEEFGTLPEGAQCVCIGPVTAAALRARTGRLPLTAERASAEAVAEAVLRRCQEPSPDVCSYNQIT